MLKLKLTNANYSGANAIVIEDVVKDIRQDENLTTNLESSSLLWKVTIPHDSQYIPYIVNEEEWEAMLYDENAAHIITPFFTGYLSDSISWVINQHGQNALQLTLEDKGVHLLKAPFTKDESIVISGKFSYVDSQIPEYGVVQQICNVAGISWVSDIITDTTSVKCVAARAETCESLLKSVCKELCMAYSFNANGELYLIPLSTDNITATDTVDDTEIYDSVTLSKKTVTYKGSRVEWDELNTINSALVYRDISNQSTIHPECFIKLEAGDTYPSPDGAITYYQAQDLAYGAEVFSISNLSPTVHWWDGSGTVQIQQYGADTLAILITGVNSGHIDKLQATANLTYIKSKNVVYGDSGSITESLKEEKCKWIHNAAAAEKYANFLAQYYKYCSRTFTFKSKKTYKLGELIQLHENVHTGLTTYLMVTKRVRTLVDYSSTDKAFSGVWTYEAVSTSEFNYDKPTTNESLWIPPTNTYVEVPDISGIVLDVSDFRLNVSPANLVADRRRTDSQTITISTVLTGYTGTPTIKYWYGDGDPDHPWEIVADSVVISLPYDHKHPSLNVVAELDGAPTQSMVLTTIDETEEYLYFGGCSIDTSGYYDAEGQPDVSRYSQVDWSEINDQLGSNEKFLDGDSFFNHYSETTPADFNDVYIYVYQLGYWVPINFSNYSNSVRSRICMQAQKDVLSTIETGSVVQSDFGYFNTIIAGTVTADYIGGKEIEVHDGGFIYAGDVDLNQSVGHRVGSTGAGFCFDSQGNAEMSNIRITGDSTIEGGSTVLGTLINYDTANPPKPVFKTVKETDIQVSMAGSKTDGTNAPNAYLWNSFTEWLKNSIIAGASSGTYYSASGTIYANWSGSIVSRSVIGIRYWPTVPTTTNTFQVNGDRGAGTVETKTMYTNSNAYNMIFSKLAMHPKTDQSIWGVTGYGELKVTTYTSGGSVYQVLCNQGEIEGNYGAGMAYAYNVVVPPGGYIVAEAGTYSGHPWGQWDTDLYITFSWAESDMFSDGINFVLSGGSAYSFNSVMPTTSSFSTYPQSLTCSGLSISLSMMMDAASNWPVEKYYRFSYSTSPGVSSAITTSIFSSQSFSYRGNTRTVASITYSNTYLKVIDTFGQPYEFYTSQGYYYPRHSFSFTTLGESLGAYMRSVLPTDDPNTHDVGASGTYASGVSQRWSTGFFTTLDVSQGISAREYHGDLGLAVLTTNTTLGAMEVNNMRIVLSRSATVTMPASGSFVVFKENSSGLSVVSLSGGQATSCSGDTLVKVVRVS